MYWVVRIRRLRRVHCLLSWLPKSLADDIYKKFEVELRDMLCAWKPST